MSAHCVGNFSALPFCYRCPVNHSFTVCMSQLLWLHIEPLLLLRGCWTLTQVIAGLRLPLFLWFLSTTKWLLFFRAGYHLSILGMIIDDNATWVGTKTILFMIPWALLPPKWFHHSTLLLYLVQDLFWCFHHRQFFYSAQSCWLWLIEHRGSSLLLFFLFFFASNLTEQASTVETRLDLVIHFSFCNAPVNTFAV